VLTKKAFTWKATRALAASLSAAIVLGAGSVASAFTVTQIGTSGGSPGGQPVYQISGLVEGDTFGLGWSYLGGPGTADDITGTATVTVFDVTATDILLNITISDTSGDASARLVSFGFNTDPNATAVALSDTGASDTDAFSNTALTTNFPGYSTIDVCVFAGPNCSGGGGGGLQPGQTDSFRLDLSGSWGSSFTLDTFAAKFQSNGGSFELPGTPGGGGPPTQVPLPATLVMLGAGLAGLAVIGRAKR
jgi:hypothetical protein